MKTFTTTALALFVAFAAYSQSQILLVDNTPTAPSGSHVYSDIQSAISATSPGDIIHVKPSGTNYGGVTITEANDSISIFGIGYNAEKEIGQTSQISTLYIDGYNIRIAGLHITSTVHTSYNANAGNITYDNCRFDGSVYVANYGVTSNVVMRNCLFRSTVRFQSNANSTVITNSIFSFGTSSNQLYECHNGTLISHCMFFGDNSGDNPIYNMTNSTVSNTIFYGVNQHINNTNSNNTFNNCFGIYAADTTSNATTVNNPIGSISGGVFADATIAPQSGWSINWDPDLDAASTELTTGGDDGTAVGVTGGTIPYNVNGTPLPYIRSFIVPTVIKQGDDLPVEINAIGN